MFKRIHIIKTKKLIYVAIDETALRAKMNQKCLKIFQTVLEAQEKKNYQKEEFKNVKNFINFKKILNNNELRKN